MDPKSPGGKWVPEPSRKSSKKAQGVPLFTGGRNVQRDQRGEGVPRVGVLGPPGAGCVLISGGFGESRQAQTTGAKPSFSHHRLCDLGGRASPP